MRLGADSMHAGDSLVSKFTLAEKVGRATESEEPLATVGNVTAGSKNVESTIRK